MKAITKETLIQACNLALESNYNSNPINISGLTVWFSQERGNCKKAVWDTPQEHYCDLFGIAYLINCGKLPHNVKIEPDMFDNFLNKNDIVTLLKSKSKSNLITDDVLLLLNAYYPWSENFITKCFHPARLTDV